MNERYLAWNDGLIAHAFTERDAGRPVYLSVDVSELERVAESIGVKPELAVDDFAESVRRACRPPSDPFKPFRITRRNWRSERELPPYVAALGLCVLAGSRMMGEPDRNIVSGDYYVRLNELLGLPLEAGAPGGFESMSLLWEDLAKWLDEDLAGARGLSTIHTHDFFVHIGWPLSQCILRASDRRRLPDFFRSARLLAGEKIPPERLLVLLRAWARDGCGLSQHGRRVVHAERAAAELGPLVARELELWDGQLRDVSGRRRAIVHLHADTGRRMRKVRFGFVARRPSGFPVGEFSLPDGRPITLEAAATDWYKPLPIEPSKPVMERGFNAVHGNFAVAHDPAPVHVLRAVVDPGGWLSASQATTLEPHMVVVRASVLTMVRSFLQQVTDGNFKQLDVETNLPGGWAVFTDVRFMKQPLTVPHGLERLVPRMNTAAALEGGLILSRTPRVYLAGGGEPDLWVSVPESDQMAVSFDGHDEVLKPGVQVIPIRGKVGDTDQHRVVVGGRSFDFTFARSFGSVLPAGAGRIGHLLERHSRYLPTAGEPVALPDAPPAGQVSLSGACAAADRSDLPADPLAPVLLPVGFTRYTLLGPSPGQCWSCEQPKRPKWLKNVPVAGGLTLDEQWQFFDVEAPFEPTYIVLQRNDGAREVRRAISAPVRPQPDIEIDEDDPFVRVWATTILGSVMRADDPVWSEYRQLASALAREA